MTNKLTEAQKRALERELKLAFERAAGRMTGQSLRKTFRSKGYSGKTTGSSQSAQHKNRMRRLKK
jgi:hypothetical protein